MMQLQDVLAVVLGGGRGARLYPLTKLRAKPAVPIGGKYRLIDIPLSNCINSGITRIFVLTQFLSASLHRHVFRTYTFDIFSHGFVEILAAEQTLTGADWYQGTADAVRQQMHRFLSRGAEDVLILAGDHLYRMDYSEFVRVHRESRADVTIAVLPVTAEDAPRFGILRTNDEGRIIAFREKPQGAEELAGLESRHGDERPYLASMGIYVFRMDVLIRLLEEITEDDFGHNIVPAAIESARVYSFLFDDYWVDIGTISAFYEANLALTQENRPFDFYDPHRPIYTRSRFLPPSRIDGCQMDRVVVAEGCWVYDADIAECIIGLRSVVRPGAQLRQVVMMGADFYEDDDEKAENRRLGRPHVGIGHDARIERAIIDKNARIGQRVVIRSHEGEPDQEEEYYVIRDGIAVIPKNAVIPDGTTV
jgi:glucose-1-phosphate adenylyltransferase